MKNLQNWVISIWDHKKCSCFIILLQATNGLIQKLQQVDKWNEMKLLEEKTQPEEKNETDVE